MAGFDNEVMFSSGERLEEVTALSQLLLQETSTDVGRVSYSGSPEGVISANPSSLSHDSTTGNIYYKSSGTGNTGWALMNNIILSIQVFTSSGTYTPTSGMKYCVVECIGGGGGGGGVSGALSQASAAGGGAGGIYSLKVLSASAIGASKSVSVGAGGNAGSSTPGPGGAGGTSSLSTLVTAQGGGGGSASSASATISTGQGASNPGLAAVVSDYSLTGNAGESGVAVFPAGYARSGGGGMSARGGGGGRGLIVSMNASTSGSTGGQYGGGGGGGVTFNNASNSVGGAGFQGVVIITEYR